MNIKDLKHLDPKVAGKLESAVDPKWKNEIYHYVKNQFIAFELPTTQLYLKLRAEEDRLAMIKLEKSNAELELDDKLKRRFEKIMNGPSSGPFVLN